MSLDSHISPFLGVKQFQVAYLKCFQSAASHAKLNLLSTSLVKSLRFAKHHRCFRLVSLFVESDVPVLHSKQVDLYKIKQLNCGQLSVSRVYASQLTLHHSSWIRQLDKSLYITLKLSMSPFIIHFSFWKLVSHSNTPASWPQTIVFYQKVYFQFLCVKKNKEKSNHTVVQGRDCGFQIKTNLILSSTQCRHIL